VACGKARIGQSQRSLNDLFHVLSENAPDIAAQVADSLIATGKLWPEQILNYKLGTGLTVSSTATPALDGTYAIDSASQNRLAAIAAGNQCREKHSRFSATQWHRR
jgi:hypothetical protein